MGCISSKQARSRKKSPVFYSPVDVIVSRGNNGIGGSVNLDSSLKIHTSIGFGTLEKIREEPEKEESDESVKKPPSVCHHVGGGHSGNNSKSLKKNASTSVKRAAFSFKFGRLTEGEHVAAGWPAWLTAVAGEAIEGWLPLRSDSFERLEKVIINVYCHPLLEKH